MISARLLYCMYIYQHMNTDEQKLDTGFSVYIEGNKTRNKSRGKEDSAPNFSNNDSFRSVLNRIYPKYMNKWVDETLVRSCQLCNSGFGWLITRKHHCRACGCVFCSDCCNKYIKIPQYIKKPEEKDTFRSQFLYLRYGKLETSLVCNECYDKIENLEEIQEKITIAEYYNLENLFVTLRISKEWYNA